MWVIILFNRFVSVALSVIILLIPISAYGIDGNDISAECAVVLDAATGIVHFEKNAYLKHSMASTTKIMTCVLACESGKLNDTVTVSENAIRNTEGTSLYLKAGDKITLRDLVKGAMLESGNDAANAIACYLAGDISRFADIMNVKAKEIGMNNTNFVTPSGLDAKLHYSSACDMAILAAYASDNTELLKIASLLKDTISVNGYKRAIKNHNKLLNVSKCFKGFKTGFTKKSGRCLVSASRKDGKFIIAVTLNDKNDWADHRELLDIGLSSVSVRDVKSYSNSINILNGEKQRIDVLSDNMSISANGDAEIITETYLPMFVYAPIGGNEIIGYNVFYCNGSEIGRQKIKSSEDIKIKKQKKTEKIMQMFICIFRSINERQ